MMGFFLYQPVCLCVCVSFSGSHYHPCLVFFTHAPPTN